MEKDIYKRFRFLLKMVVNREDVKKKKILILPFGFEGHCIAEILRSDYGIEPAIIIDNQLCRYNKNIYSIDILKKLQLDEYIVILTSNIEELRLAVRETVPEQNFIDLFWDQRDLRVDWLERFAKTVYARHMEGAVAECGVYKGDFSYFINLFFHDRKCYLVDPFEGFRSKDLQAENELSSAEYLFQGMFGDTDANIVKNRMPYPQNVELRIGYVPEVISGLGDKFCFVNLDMDLYLPMLEGLKNFYPLLIPGGVLMLHDYYWIDCPGVKKAVADYEKMIGAPLYKVNVGDSMSIAIIKQAEIG